MKQTFNFFLLVFSVFGFIGCNISSSTESTDQLYLWSHNDYEQEEPLHAALDLGFQMIEADIHLIKGELYVIHDHPENIETTPLLEDLYLQPLAERIEQNNGQILPGESLPFYLIIDVKTESEPTYQALLNTLEPYSQYFYQKVDGEWVDGPIRLLISGNRPELDASASNRIAFLDGRIPNLGMDYSSELYPLISDNWFNYFTWDGQGDIPGDELEKLRDYVSQAHQEDKLIRFWATSDNENVWRTLINNGVDVINVDDIEGMRRFLDQNYSEP